MAPEPAIVGCDVGGTFTDFFCLQQGRTAVLKVPSRPLSPDRAVLEGLAELAPGICRLVHGSTVATNAVLERRGARTALITTEGFRDVIEIGRQARPRLYELEPRRPPPLVPRGLRFEAPERVLAGGEVERPLSPQEAGGLVASLPDEVEAVAVCLLFSFLHPEHERLLGEAVRARGLWVSASHEVLPEYREYERTSTTAVNAYVGPLVSRYLSALEAASSERGVASLDVMNSAGGVVSAEDAGRLAAQTILSGPAGGVAGAFYTAASAGWDRIITLDMGGTSTDVALCDGTIAIQTEATIDGMPVRLPSVDVHTVGAGGGSLAWLDAGDALQVGPQSAGADPGPAAYGKASEPAVTDAHVVLGHLPAPLSGHMALDRKAARQALESLPAFSSAEDAAAAVLATVTATMERALRVVSLERGHDPRDFVLVPFGGAGPLHGCALAEALGITRVLVPEWPGVLSAIGMALAPARWEGSAPMLMLLSEAGAAERLAEEAAALERQAPDLGGARDWLADLRFRGQAYELRVPLSKPDPVEAAAALQEAHQRRFGFVPSGEPEVVNLRLVASGKARTLPPREVQRSAKAEQRTVEIFGPEGWEEVPWLDRAQLLTGARFTGPAVVTQYDCTTLVPVSWKGEVDAQGNLLLEPR